MSVENKKRRFGVGRRNNNTKQFEEPEQTMEELFGTEDAQRLREMNDALDNIIGSVCEQMRKNREAGIRSPDPDDSLPDDEDQLRPGWDKD